MGKLHPTTTLGAGRCERCGATCDEDRADRISRVTAWATKHANANPGHRVVVSITRHHIYERPAT